MNWIVWVSFVCGTKPGTSPQAISSLQWTSEAWGACFHPTPHIHSHLLEAHPLLMHHSKKNNSNNISVCNLHKCTSCMQISITVSVDLHILAAAQYVMICRDTTFCIIRHFIKPLLVMSGCEKKLWNSGPGGSTFMKGFVKRGPNGQKINKDTSSHTLLWMESPSVTRYV